MVKEKLTLDEQIAHMERKGIKFGIIAQKEAKEILSGKTYYFKLKSYAKIYPKDAQGLYQGLEFAYMYEISKMDVAFRNFILTTALAIEHLTKTALLNAFNTSNEDGYSIVERFLQADEGKNAQDELQKYESSNISIRGGNYALVTKYKDEMPIWVFVELIGFNNFIKFYIFYQQNVANCLPNIDRVALEGAKWLRNLAAHNNCVLIKILNTNQEQRKHLFKKLSAYKMNIIPKNSTYTLEYMMKKSLVVDFLDMIDLFFQICKSANTKAHLIAEFDALMLYIEKYQRTLDSNQDLKNFFEFIKKSFGILKNN